MQKPIVVAAFASVAALAGCQLFGAGGGATTPAPKPRGLAIRSFSETAAVTAVQPSANTLWVGTPKGLIKWDLAKQTYVTIGQKEGLPADKIAGLSLDSKGGLWVVTPAGVSHESRGAFSNHGPAEVGPFASGVAATDDGALWVGGPEGLARLAGGKWTRYLTTDLAVTALAASGSDVWVGTSGKGVLRIHGEQVEVFGAEQGCETDVVRGLAATPSGVMVIGEGPGGPRMAFFDGKRFWSYKIDGGKGVLEWIRRAGDRVLLGAGSQVYSIERLSDGDKLPPGAPLRLSAIDKKAVKPAPKGSAHGDLPQAAAADAPPKAPPPAAGKAAQKRPVPTETPKEDEAQGSAPAWSVASWGPPLPDGVTCVGTDGLSLYVGTRFLGASKVEESGLTHFRTYDLVRDAERLSVACQTETDCWVATGTERAWRFDGQSFSAATVDPESGSRVLAVLEPPRGSVVAVHRGPSDPTVRFSSVSSEGSWTPTALTELHVPTGVPDVTFATYAPTGHLWLGLRYIDKDGEKIDYGAAEVDFDSGKVTYHRQSRSLGAGSLQLPNDMESAYFVSDGEAWFGTRSGAVHRTGDKLTTYTENDGLESEIIHDVLEGPDKKIWVATSHGVGKFDGARWAFPPDGDPLRVKASSLARDRFGSVFVGAREGLVLCEPQKGGEGLKCERLDSSRGLLDNAVLDLAVDKRGRVWVLTEKGISVVVR